MGLSPDPIVNPRARQAAGLFQLVASLLDWIGDELIGKAEIETWLPRAHFRRMLVEQDFRRGLIARVRQRASPHTGALAMLLGALLEMIDSWGWDSTRLHGFLSIAYEAELASFRPIASAGERLSLAHCKSTAPTLVVGELARLAVNADESGTIWQAATLIAPVFGTIDDLADLSEDLTRGNVNTFCSMPAALAEPIDDRSIISTLKALLAAEVVEEGAANVVRKIRELDRLLKEVHVDSQQRQRALEWLRTVVWRWLY